MPKDMLRPVGEKFWRAEDYHQDYNAKAQEKSGGGVEQDIDKERTALVKRNMFNSLQGALGMDFLFGGAAGGAA